MKIPESQNPDIPDTNGRKTLPPPPDMEELKAKAKLLTPDQIRQKVSRLNDKIRFGAQTHEIEVSVDPSIQTWACARVPRKQVQRDGTIVDTNYHHYIIVMPYAHLAIADDAFIVGELRHELGHALFTDWRMSEKLEKTAEAEGYPKEAMGMTLNCLEDPRMEHVSAYPLARLGYIKDFFWAKNKALILPKIGEGIAKNSPVWQFMFLIKLVSLWSLHKKQADEENIAPWDNINSLHPDVHESWEKIKPAIEHIVGFGSKNIPEMRSDVMEKMVRQIIWPELKNLIDKHGFEQDKGDKGEGEGNGQPGNPDDMSNLPPDVQKLINQQIDKYKQQLAKQQQQQIDSNKATEDENKKIAEERDKRLEKQDGIESSANRKKYNELAKQAHVVRDGMRRVFEKYFPQIASPKDTFARRGKTYNHREHLKRFGSGMEKPMATPNVPEKKGFILQLIIDVSGSMKNGRLEEVIKTVIGILEAAQDFPIYIEILASDNKNGGTGTKEAEEYILKPFDAEFSGVAGGRIREKLVTALDKFGGGNKDDESLKFAVPRIVKKRSELRSQYDNLASLVIFLSDAEVQGQQDPNVVNDLRKKVAILGGVIEPNPAIKAAVQQAYGPEGEGSFCPDSLEHISNAIEKVLRKKIRSMFKTS